MNSRFNFRAWDSRANKMLYKGFVIAPTSPTWSASMVHGDAEINKKINKYYEKKGDVFGGDYSLIDYSDWYGIENLTIMQCTGIKDKNDKFIFEKDIIRNGKGVILYSEIKAAFVVKWNDNIYKKVRGEEEYLFLNSKIVWEVIGNIYENPELLK